MHNALGADVHPAAGRHLAVVGHADGGSTVEVLLIVEGADHESVGDDAPGRQLMRAEQAQGMAGHDHQRLLVGQNLQILFDEPVLHPVLADLARFPVGDQLIGVEGDVKIQIVVDHHLEGLGLHTVPLILVDGLAVNPSLGAEAIAIDPAMLFQLLCKFLRHPAVMLPGNVAQRVHDRQFLIRLRKVGFPAGRTAAARFKGRVLRQVIVQLQNLSVEICHCKRSSFRNIRSQSVHTELYHVSNDVLKPPGGILFGTSCAEPLPCRCSANGRGN